MAINACGECGCAMAECECAERTRHNVRLEAKAGTWRWVCLCGAQSNYLTSYTAAHNSSVIHANNLKGERQ